MLRRAPAFIAAGAFAFGWSHVFLLPYCGFLFRCGCTWLWSGGIAQCNIYNPATPDCPWCTAPAWSAWIPVWGTPVLMLLLSGIVLGRSPNLRGALRALSLAMLIFLGGNLVNAYGFKVAMGYPYFLWVGPPEDVALNGAGASGSIPLRPDSHAHHH